MRYDTVIIGGGISGLSAALYAGRFQLKTLVLADKLGGTIILTDDISNYPGFRKISGMDLFDKIKEHAKDYGIDLKEKKVEKLEKCQDCFKVYSGHNIFEANTVIFATGTEWRKLNVPGEKEFSNKGVHYCALCDGALYKDKVVGIVGGSDSAAKEALMLAQYAKKVFIIYRKEKIRSEPVNLSKVEKNDKITVVNKANVKEIKGDKLVNSVILDTEFNGSNELKLDGLFINIGHIPLSALAKDIGVRLNQKNEIVTDENSATNIPGVYACGDVVNSRFKQAITGAAEGVIAAYNVYRYVKDELPVCGCSEDT